MKSLKKCCYVKLNKSSYHWPTVFEDRNQGQKGGKKALGKSITYGRNFKATNSFSLTLSLTSSCQESTKGRGGGVLDQVSPILADLKIS